MTRLEEFAAALLLGCLGGAWCSAGAPASQHPPRAQTKTNQPQRDPLALLLQQAEEAVEKKNYASAVELLRSYLAQRPDDALAHFQLGYAYTALERTEEARTEYERAIALNPKLAGAHLNMGLTLLERDAAAAARSFRQAADLLPDQPRPRYLLGVALERTGNLAGAIEQYQAAQELDPKDAEIRLALGQALLRAGRAREAETHFRQALALRGNLAPARQGLAHSLLVQKNLEGAAEEFKAYLDQQPQDRLTRRQRAAVLVELKRYEQALEELERSEAGAPLSLEGCKLRAEIYLAQKNLDGAAAALQTALQLTPGDAELHAKLGRLWLEKRDFAPAEVELQRALQLDPNWTDALRDLVAAYYLDGKYQAALAALDLLARRENPNAGSWFVRATCYDKLDRKAEAVAAYEKFLELDQGRSEDHGFQARQRIRLLKREVERKKR